MPLAWNEIRHRAIKFANENSHAASEAGEKQTFWNEFFDVFGIPRKTIASFKAGGYTGHELRQFLVRILFCLFAEDTGIFLTKSFRFYNTPCACVVRVCQP